MTFEQAVKIALPLRTAVDPPDDSAYEERCDRCGNDTASCVCVQAVLEAARTPDPCPQCADSASPWDAPYCSSQCALAAEHENDLDGFGPSAVSRGR